IYCPGSDEPTENGATTDGKQTRAHHEPLPCASHLHLSRHYWRSPKAPSKQVLYLVSGIVKYWKGKAYENNQSRGVKAHVRPAGKLPPGDGARRMGLPGQAYSGIPPFCLHEGGTTIAP